MNKLSDLLKESVLNGAPDKFLGDMAEAALVDEINSSRQPKGGKVTTDTWGHPVTIGDYVIGIADGEIWCDNTVPFQSNNNLVVGQILGFYNGGIEALILSPHRLTGRWQSVINHMRELGGVTSSIKIKCGFIKIDPKMLKQIFNK